MAQPPKRHPVQAAGRYIAYGSTRYTAKGSKKSHAALKGFGSAVAGGIAGGAVGGLTGSPTGAQIGGSVGTIAGRRFAAHRGYIRRDKQRFTLRHTNASFGHADPHFRKSIAHHTM